MARRDVRLVFGRSSRATAALACVAFSALVLLLCVLAGVHFKREVEQELYRESQNIAQMLMAGFDNDAATADAILTHLANEIPQDEVTAAREPELHRLLTGYALQASMIGPAILDRDGTLIASARVEPVPKISLKDRNTFRVHAGAPGESTLYIGTPTRGLLTNEWAIQFSRPMRDKSGNLYGVVLLSYRLEHWISLYEKLKLSDRGLAGLTGRDGIIRIRTLNGEIGYGSAVSSMPLVHNRVLAGETSGTFFSRVGPDGLKRLGSFVASPTSPFYVTVGYDTGYLRARYLGYFYALGLCWLVLTAAMVGAAAVIHRLGKLTRETELQVINSAIAERQKIAADMHDNIGAGLAALLAYFTTENINMADVKRRIGEILMELRFLVDSSETDDGDINLLLSNVRYRMGASIELAGIALRWEVGELPAIPGLTARDALAIRLILMETLSNVLHHSKATSAGLAASFDPQAAVISICVSDDGRGFNPADAGAGRGLTNIRRRIATISTGAAIIIDSSPAHGTTVRIELKVPPEANKPAVNE